MNSTRPSPSSPTHLGNQRATPGGPSPRADRIGRVLTYVAGGYTLLAFAGGIFMVANASADRVWIEAWRTFTFPVIAVAFFALARRPRSIPGLWEILLASKTALVVFSLFVGHYAAEARLHGLNDILLIAMFGSGYVLTRGWLAWRAARTDPAPSPA